MAELNKKKKQKNIYLFLGEDRVSLYNQLRHWKKQFIEKHQDLNVDTVEVRSRKDIKEIITKMNALPFLAEKRLLIVKGLPEEGGKSEEKKDDASKDGMNDELASLSRECDTLSDSTIIIFVAFKPDKRRKFYKDMEKKAEIKEFQVFKGKSLSSWIHQELQHVKIQASSSEVEFFREFCGDSMDHVQKEIVRLHLLGTQKLSRDNIRAYCIPHTIQNIFQLTELIGTNRKKELLQRFQKIILQGEALQMIFFMIVRQIRLLTQIRFLLDEGQQSRAIQTRLKLHPFQLNALIKQADIFTLVEIKLLFTKAIELDKKVKTGKIPSSADQQQVYAAAIQLLLV